MSITIPAIHFSQRRTQMYIAAVPVDFLERFSVDIWDPKNVMGHRGYQRKPEDKRIKAIAKYFERTDAIMPVAGLLNVRERGRIKFKNGKLTIPDGINVWVVDMQHRLRGLVRAQEESVIRPNTFSFPVVITEGLSRVDEAAQFYLINTKAKKMDVALTRRLLIEKNKVKDIADVKPWEIAAVRITIDLNNSFAGSPWFGRIRQPNEERMEQHVATEKSFVSSLRQLLISGRHKQTRKAAKLLANYWSAIRANIPEAFAEPKKYLLQRTPGMFAFNFFIGPEFLAKNRNPARFEAQLSGLKKLGAAFWRRTNKRGARKFGTGMAGYANLADYLKREIL
jgi:DGQHR domain-containing protein